MIDRYIDQSYMLYWITFFAEFLRYYYLASGESKDNDYQPNILQNDLIEHNHNHCFKK